MANLLIVDNHEAILDTFSWHFREVVGWNVEVARNGKEAISILADKADYFHGVILDKNMPEATGDEVVRWMFERELLDDICVVLFTGHPEVNSAVDALRMGAWQYLVKGAMTPAEVETFIAPGIALKSLHRIRQDFWRRDDGVTEALRQIERIVHETVAPDDFRVYFLSRYLSRDLSEGTEPPAREREFVKRIVGGSPFVSARTKADAARLNPSLIDTGTLMAVPVHDGTEVLGVMAMESFREGAFDPRWLEVLSYFAETISIAQLILEKRIAERESLDLTQRELRHRIKNSLGIIEQCASELAREPLRETAAQRVGFIQAHRERISGVLDELQAVATPPEVSRQFVRVREVVREVILQRTSAVDGDTAFELMEAGPAVIALADRDLLHDALLCLANNSIEAIEARRTFDSLDPTAEKPQPPSHIRGLLKPGQTYWIVFDIREVEDQSSIQIRVSDSGVGFGDNIKERLFNPLFSTKRRTRPADERGMGLFSSKRGVTAMGGSLDGASPGPYMGAVFTVTLLKAKVPAEEHDASLP